ncbi:MAG: alpha/beta hydrolase [Planctomycetota bacterium]|nr:alpha/beta hydrolase [Planctomycetota bacterium]MDA1213194.1 alpha/beta hydrolase [Planctomycetota bacterium]
MISTSLPVRWAFAIVVVALSRSPLLAADETAGHPRFPLWEGKAPFATGDEEKDTPTLTVYAPEKCNGCAVVVFPGGGYGGLALGHEGDEIGKWYNSFGVTAFILRYRHAPGYQHPVPLTDAQRAVRWVRTNAETYHLDPERIGVMGFSAGGHLASTIGTHFDAGNADAKDPIDRASCRPDFLVLCYPVISLNTDYVHKGSKRNLLGEDPAQELVDDLSNDLQVTKETPPTFLFHTNDDTGVVPENSILFYMALRKSGVPAELHIYEPGRHGVGLASKDPILSNWPDRLKDWLTHRQFVPQL